MKMFLLGQKNLSDITSECWSEIIISFITYIKIAKYVFFVVKTFFHSTLLCPHADLVEISSLFDIYIIKLNSLNFTAFMLSSFTEAQSEHGHNIGFPSVIW